jgi:hypothetical protein
MSVMRVSIEERGVLLRQRLQERLDRVAQLRCSEHGRPVVAVSIHDRENGWFDSTWTTCCESLERQAAGIVRGRC